MVAVDNSDKFEVGRVTSRTFAVLGRNWMTFLILAAILTLPSLALTFYLTGNPVFAAAASGTKAPIGLLPQYLITISLTGLVGGVFAFVLQAALVQGTVMDLNGERPSLGVCLSTGFKVFLPLVVLTILLCLGVVLGTILLVVPGLMLLIAWFVVVPVKVVEKTGIGESFGRSRDLTKGSRWKIFLLLVLYFLLAGIIELAMRPLFGIPLIRPSAATLAAPYLVLAWVVRVPLTAIAAIGTASVYYELRTIKEGIAPQQLAAAFD